MKARRPAAALAVFVATPLALMFFPGMALAHPEAGMHLNAFSGLMHPLLGADHLLAMLMVGVWAAQQQGWKRLALPLTFVVFMAIGSLLTLLDIPAIPIETGIALSVLALGLFAALAVQLPALLMFALVGAFASLHGIAHGTELPVAASGLYMPAYLASTALLHAIGFLFANTLADRKPLILKTVGGLVALSGLAMLLN